MDNEAQVDTLLEQMRTVRQARQYRPGPVSDDVLDRLLEVARWTGSSQNKQPWHFIAITDKDTLHQISQLRERINWVAQAPLAIAIVLDGTNAIQDAYDEGRVTERLLIGARVLGLGGGIAWFGDAEHEATAKRLLGIPTTYTAHSIVALGYPRSLSDPRPAPTRGGRKPLSELVSHNRWSARF